MSSGKKRLVSICLTNGNLRLVAFKVDALGCRLDSVRPCHQLCLTATLLATTKSPLRQQNTIQTNSLNHNKTNAERKHVKYGYFVLYYGIFYSLTPTADTHVQGYLVNNESGFFLCDTRYL